MRTGGTAILFGDRSGRIAQGFEGGQSGRYYFPDPDAPRQRIVLDPASVNRDAALKEIAAGHWAAV